MVIAKIFTHILNMLPVSHNIQHSTLTTAFSGILCYVIVDMSVYIN